MDGTYSFSRIASIDVDQSGLTRIHKIFPNPAKDETTVQLFSEYSQKLKADLYAQNGSLLREFNLACNEGLNTFSIDLKGMTAGSYHLVLRSSSGTVRQVLVKIP